MTLLQIFFEPCLFVDRSLPNLCNRYIPIFRYMISFSQKILETFFNYIILFTFTSGYFIIFLEIINLHFDIYGKFLNYLHFFVIFQPSKCTQKYEMFKL